MWKRLACVLLVLVGAGLALNSAVRGGGKDKIRVVIIDGQNNHDWRSTTPFLKKVLLDSGRFSVDVSTGPLSQDDIKKKRGLPKGWEAIPFPPDLSKYDVVLSNYNGESWPKDFQQALDENLKSGKVQLVIVHAANNSFNGWKEYNLMIGMGWHANNNYGPRLIVDEQGKEVRVPKGKGPGSSHGSQHAFKIVVRDSSHPITKGMPKEWLHAQDELYHGMRGPVENVHLLATAYDDKSKGGTGENEPMIWTVTYGKGRVFHTPMGHDLNGMRCIGFITTLLRGTEWAATGKVTQPIPSNFPEADKTSSVK
jgi:type 1 glutamine amidotransferase